MNKHLPEAGLLVLGVVCTAFLGNRWNVALLGWVTAVPWLLYLRRTSGWKSRTALALVVQVGTFLNIAVLVTEPIPWTFAPMFSVPGGIATALLLVAFESWRRRIGDAWGLAVFVSLQVAAEFLQSRLSEAGTWGSPAYSQLDNLALLQVTSVFGLAGVTTLLAASSGLLAIWLDVDDRSRWRPAAVGLVALILLTHLFGALRLDHTFEGEMVTVAAVSTDIGLGGGTGLPPPEEIRRANDALFARTELVLQQGAQLVVWNEGSTLVEKDAEPGFIDRGLSLAREHQADVVLAYVVPFDGMKKFENKYVWLTSDGVVETYLKRHPVPGEGSIKGTGPIRVIERPWGKAAGAICYDYDFPALGQAHAAGGAGLVFVPSSDWRGIDPTHTLMARVRGIEGGFSVVRSVRWATSGAYDALGRARGTASYFEGERVLMARVPAERVETLYSKWGEVLPTASFLVLLVGLVVLFRRRRED